VKNGKDMLARGQMLIAANLAGFASAGAGWGIVHALAHIVGAKYKVHHGLANSILLPACMRYNGNVCGDIYLKILSAMGVDIQRVSPEEAGDVLAERLAEFTKKLGLPQRLREAGVPEEGLKECSELALSDGAILYNSKFVSDSADVLKIYQQAW
jgi:alcohol dehydrogenase class IV